MIRYMNRPKIKPITVSITCTYMQSVYAIVAQKYVNFLRKFKTANNNIEYSRNSVVLQVLHERSV